MPSLRARPLTDAEWDEMSTFSANAFLGDPTPEPVNPGLLHRFLERDRYRGVADEQDRLIGAGGLLTRTITLPGAGPSPLAGVTFVGVRPDSRGQGALSTLMRDLLEGLHGSGEPIAALWASMAPIYGRFGYGLSARRATLTVPGRAPFRPGTPTGGAVRWYSAEEALPLMRRVFEELLPTRPGWVSRSDANWDWWFRDDPASRYGSTSFRYAVHHAASDGRPDGYAVFRAKADWPAAGPDYRLDVKELISADPEAHASLWRSLLDLDMVGKVSYDNVPLDDPLPLVLVNPRAALTDVSDLLWVRLVDLDRALPARRYAAPCDVVLEVADRFCPWNAGRWRLRVDERGAAEASRTDRPADLECGVADLGAAFLGGVRLTALAGAGRVREQRAGALRALCRAMAGETEPYCANIF
ncbi:putative acetyltransferase [Pseudonocardia eucalypti]|nr:putative acetyltransferase [Pseudonocardia eucalypti]